MSDIDTRLHFTAVDQLSNAVNGMKQSLGGLAKQTEATAGRFDFLKDAMKTAAGVMMRDLANSAARSIGESMELGASVQSLRSSFDSLVKTTGGTSLSLEKLRKATKGTVADVDLLKAANQAMALGLPTDDINKLMGSAMKLGRAMGIDTLSAVTSLATGIGRQSKLILDNLGITFQAEDAYKWYAEQLGVTSSELDENQKRLAWQTYAIEEVTRRAEELGTIQDEAVTKQEQWNASIKNFQTNVGQATGPFSAFVGVIKPFLPMLGLMGAQLLPKIISQLPSLLGYIKDINIPLKDMGLGWKGAAAGVTGFIAGFTGGITLLKALPENLRGIASALMLGIGAIVAATVAWMAFHGAMSGPLAPVTVGIMLAAIGAAIAGLMGLLAPHLIGLAEGGIVTKPTVALIGEKGPEAVVPLGRGGLPQIREVFITQYNDISRDVDVDYVAERCYDILMKKLGNK